MPNPFQPQRRKYETRGRMSDVLQERVALLGYPLSDYEALVEAFGDPDVDDTAVEMYAIGDSGLRNLIAAAKGENPDGYRPAKLANHPTADVEGFDIGWSIHALLDYVGSDVDRAADVMHAEEEKEAPRSTLIAALYKIAGE